MIVPTTPAPQSPTTTLASEEVSTTILPQSPTYPDPTVVPTARSTRQRPEIDTSSMPLVSPRRPAQQTLSFPPVSPSQPILRDGLVWPSQ